MTDEAHILQFRSTHEYYRTTKYEGQPTIGDNKNFNFMMLAVHFRSIESADRGVGMDTLFKVRMWTSRIDFPLIWRSIDVP